MKKKLFTMLAILLVMALSTSTVSAAGFKLSAGFKLGSLIADGTISGIGHTDWILKLNASGNSLVACVNNGGKVVPGQNAPLFESSGSELLPGTDPLRKNGKSPFGLETQKEDSIVVPWDVAGCPSSTWTGRIIFVLWDQATISVIDPLTNEVVDTFHYRCVTTPNHAIPTSVTDGTVTCSPQ